MVHLRRLSHLRQIHLHGVVFPMYSTPDMAMIASIGSNVGSGLVSWLGSLG